MFRQDIAFLEMFLSPLTDESPDAIVTPSKVDIQQRRSGRVVRARAPENRATATGVLRARPQTARMNGPGSCQAETQAGVGLAGGATVIKGGDFRRWTAIGSMPESTE